MQKLTVSHFSYRASQNKAWRWTLTLVDCFRLSNLKWIAWSRLDMCLWVELPIPRHAKSFYRECRHHKFGTIDAEQTSNVSSAKSSLRQTTGRLLRRIHQLARRPRAQSRSVDKEFVVWMLQIVLFDVSVEIFIWNADFGIMTCEDDVSSRDYQTEATMSDQKTITDIQAQSVITDPSVVRQCNCKRWLGGWKILDQVGRPGFDDTLKTEQMSWVVREHFVSILDV